MNNIHASTHRHLTALGLERAPFPVTPDAHCYFHTRLLQEEMAEAAHCVMAHKGFVLVTGEIGLGKSTFVRRLADTVLQQDCDVSFVLNTFGTGDDLLRAINLDFGLEPGGSVAEDIARLNAFLVRQHAAGRTTLVVVDDAQNMGLDSLELMRMLSNFETSQEKLVQILLCGQPELVDKLSDPSIRQLASRIVKHVELRPLDLEETRSYVDYRLNSAGAAGRIKLAPEAVRLLHRTSAGNPRRMHLILDRCLYGLVAGRGSSIRAGLVRRAALESGIRLPRTGLRRHGVRAAIATGVACLATVVAASVLTRQGAPEPTGLMEPAALVQQAAVVPDAAVDIDMSAAASRHESCLRQFDLVDRDGRIGAALRRGDLAAIRRQIQQQNAALAVFAVPEWLPAEAAASACELTAGVTRMLLWQPPVPVDDFVFGSAGPDVLRLQQDLARSGSYHYRLDGLAGPRTTTAIADFQRRHELPATGYPDELTRYVLAHVERVAVPDRP